MIAVIGIAALMNSQPFFERWEYSTIDWRFQVRRVRPRDNSNDPVIIAIDAATLTNSSLSRPLLFWGDYHARVINNLRLLGALVIGFDIVQPHLLDGYIEPNPDAAEAMALANTPQIVLAYNRDVNPKGGVQDTYPNLTLKDVLLGRKEPSSGEHSIPEEKLGFTNIHPDSDGVVRRFIAQDTGSPSYSFALSIATQAAKRLRRNHLPSQTGRLNLPQNQVIDYLSSTAALDHISYQEILLHPMRYKTRISNKICLIGSTAPAQLDFHPVPVRTNTLPHSNLMAGVEIHANIVRTLLCGSDIWYANTYWTWLLMGMACLISNGLFWGGLRVVPSPRHTPIKSTTSLVWVIIWLLVCVIGWVVICKLTFDDWNWLLPLIPVEMTLLLTSVALLTLRWWHDHNSRQWFELVFGRYFSADVLAYFMQQPGATELGTQPQEISVMFTDIDGFTNFTEHVEQTDGRQIERFLNRYFAAMEKIIFDYDGTLDKYMGDGLMVIFNWPKSQADHARRAVQVALEMQQQVQVLNQEWEDLGFKELKIRIGIHTGKAWVGNVGTPQRMNLTAHGDVVNVASRLEAKNKEVEKIWREQGDSRERLNIVVSASTRTAFIEQLRAVQSGTTQVRSANHGRGWLMSLSELRRHRTKAMRPMTPIQVPQAAGELEKSIEFEPIEGQLPKHKPVEAYTVLLTTN
ncbi:MAG: adenylate/guanylate cyclase domain-containing protein [Abitibacteriaceae bacterium]|nr:adenylate/guanylate cyclase domain-containing protein [Abditibacteriaceae bacterium]